MQALLAAGKDVYAGERDNAGTPATSRFRDGGERLPRTFSEPSCRHARHLAPLRREGAAAQAQPVVPRVHPGLHTRVHWALHRVPAQFPPVSAWRSEGVRECLALAPTAPCLGENCLPSSPYCVPYLAQGNASWRGGFFQPLGCSKCEKIYCPRCIGNIQAKPER